MQFPKNEFPDYTPFTNHTLGTAILYKSSLNVTHHNFTCNQSERQWRTWISVFSDNAVLNICSFYFSPSSEIKSINCLTNDINVINEKNKNRLNLLALYGFAGISYFQKKTAPQGGRLNN